eukprot:1885016-Pyramimonas_sp.AAC.1
MLALEAALPSPSPCSGDVLTARMDNQRSVGLAALSLWDGPKSYISTAKRGIGDRKLFQCLTNRQTFWSIPDSWQPDETLSCEQAIVFSTILEQVRTKGWSVLSGP